MVEDSYKILFEDDNLLDEKDKTTSPEIEYKDPSFMEDFDNMIKTKIQLPKDGIIQ